MMSRLLQIFYRVWALPAGNARQSSRVTRATTHSKPHSLASLDGGQRSALPRSALLLVDRAADNATILYARHICAGLKASYPGIHTTVQSMMGNDLSMYDLVFSFAPTDTDRLISDKNDTVPFHRHFYVSTLNAVQCHRMWAGRANGVCSVHHMPNTILETLQTVAPGPRNVIFPFEYGFITRLPDPLIPFTADILEDARSTGFTTHLHGFDAKRPHESVQRLVGRCKPGDIVFLLGHSGMRAHVTSLAHACSESGVILCSDDVSAVEDGALFASGPTIEEATRAVLRHVDAVTRNKDLAPRFTALGGPKRYFFNPEILEKLLLHKENSALGMLTTMKNTYRLPTSYSRKVHTKEIV